MHDGLSFTLEEAIRRHADRPCRDMENTRVTSRSRSQLLTFLNSL